ncbi:glycosyltransferase family 2 protein, partial [Nostocales cyanobacterium LEGE 12452]|nr:glycosyltransferase family 2 protein [Nostocales cyanobacterium LEGE 12452]
MDKTKIRTSCLINNYNYAPFLSEAIDSALNQTVKFDEIIIVDDASTDNS